MMKSSAHDPFKGQRGQAFMELAISLLFLLILLCVMLDLGFAFYQLIAMRDATQEAAAYGSMCPFLDTNPDYHLIEDRLRKSASSPLDINDINSINIEYVDANGTRLTDPLTQMQQGVSSIRVTLTINHQILVPFAATFIGTDTYPLSVNVSDTILRTDTTECH